MVQRRALLLCTAVLILILASVIQGEHRELYVKSTPDQQCPQGYLCLSLINYLHNTSATFTTNTTLHFLSGKHSAVWPHNTTLVISNVSNLVLTGPEVGPGEPPHAIIWCNYTMQFHFTDTTDIAIRYILFTECGTSHTIPEQDLSLLPSPQSRFPKQPVALQLDATKNVAMETIHITWSSGYGLLVWNSIGSFSITNCKFTSNGKVGGTRTGGNVRFVFEKKADRNLMDNVLVISHSEVSYGLHDHLHQHSDGVGGMMIAVHNLPTLNIDISILSCIFHHNEANYGANLRIDMEQVYCQEVNFPCLSITLRNTSFVNGKSKEYGGGLVLRSHGKEFNHMAVEVFIINSTFLGNNIGGLFSTINSLTIMSSHFIGNSGIAARIWLFLNQITTVVLCNSTFINNTADVHGESALVVDESYSPFNNYYGGKKHSYESREHLLVLHDTHFDSNVGGHLVLRLYKKTRSTHIQLHIQTWTYSNKWRCNHHHC